MKTLIVALALLLFAGCVAKDVAPPPRPPAYFCTSAVIDGMSGLACVPIPERPR